MQDASPPVAGAIPSLARVERIVGTKLVHLAIRDAENAEVVSGLVLAPEEARAIGRELVRAAGGRGSRRLPRS